MIELTVVGATINDEVVLECSELSPEGSLMFTIVRTDGALVLKPTGMSILDLLEEVAAIAGVEFPEQ